MRRLALSALFAGLVALLVLGGSAVAAPSDSKIVVGPKAEFVTTASIEVPVTVTCPASFVTGFVSVSVSQRETGGTGFGFISPITCTGDPQTFVVLVNGGPFALGQALVSAFGGAGFGDGDVRQIQIVL